MLITNIGRLLTMEPGAGRDGTLGVICNAAVYIAQGKIVWCGPMHDMPAEARGSVATALDADGKVVMPGLIDCHTHLVFAGNRAGEFVQRMRGTSYHDIAAAGGGIMSTVAETRKASDDDLLRSTCARVGDAMSHGVTTIEIKSGYGLDVASELKILRTVRETQALTAVRCVPTFMGAHVVPAEFRDRPDAYIDLLINEMLPQIAAEQLSGVCDILIEEGAFTVAQARKIAAAAKAHGMRIRLHVDQFADDGGAALAAELGALSADHLEYASDAGIAALREAGVVAGLLPAAGLFLRLPPPPVAKFIAAGVPIAIATDCNPGTSPTRNLWLCATLAVLHYGLDPDLALLGITRVAAQALGLQAQIGSIAPGKQGDLVILGCDNEYEPFYRYGVAPVRGVVIGGEVPNE